MLISLSSMEQKTLNNTYKIRTGHKKNIYQRESLCCGRKELKNQKTLHVNPILVGITKSITMLLTDKIHHHK